MSMILYMVRHFVAKPCDCEIVEVILYSSSAHIYEGDQDVAVMLANTVWEKEEKESFIGRIKRCLRLK